MHLQALWHLCLVEMHVKAPRLYGGLDKNICQMNKFTVNEMVNNGEA